MHFVIFYDALTVYVVTKVHFVFTVKHEYCEILLNTGKIFSLF